MTLRNRLFAVFLVLFVVCLAAGYAMSGRWVGTAIAVLMGPAWWFARKSTASALPQICLFGSVALAVAGRLTGSPAILMIVGSAATLAVWDLLLLDSALNKKSSAGDARQYENAHLRSLMLALGLGLLVAVLAGLIQLQVPFFVLMLLIAFSLFALDRVWGNIKKAGRL